MKQISSSITLHRKPKDGVDGTSVPMLTVSASCHNGASPQRNMSYVEINGNRITSASYFLNTWNASKNDYDRTKYTGELPAYTGFAQYFINADTLSCEEVDYFDTQGTTLSQRNNLYNRMFGTANWYVKYTTKPMIMVIVSCNESSCEDGMRNFLKQYGSPLSDIYTQSRKRHYFVTNIRTAQSGQAYEEISEDPTQKIVTFPINKGEGVVLQGVMGNDGNDVVTMELSSSVMVIPTIGDTIAPGAISRAIEIYAYKGEEHLPKTAISNIRVSPEFSDSYTTSVNNTNKSVVIYPDTTGVWNNDEVITITADINTGSQTVTRSCQLQVTGSAQGQTVTGPQGASISRIEESYIATSDVDAQGQPKAPSADKPEWQTENIVPTAALPYVWNKEVVYIKDYHNVESKLSTDVHLSAVFSDGLISHEDKYLATTKSSVTEGEVNQELNTAMANFNATNRYFWNKETSTYKDSSKNTTNLRLIAVWGQNGDTPVIGDNGTWVIGGTDTGKPAIGQNGTDPVVYSIVPNLTVMPEGTNDVQLYINKTVGANTQRLSYEEATEEGIVLSGLNDAQGYVDWNEDDQQLYLSDGAEYGKNYTVVALRNGIQVASITIGVTAKGSRGASWRIIKWEDAVRQRPFYFYDENKLTEKINVADIVMYDYHYYLCIKSYTLSESNYTITPDRDKTHWVMFSWYENISTGLILAEKALVENLIVENVRVTDEEGETTVEMNKQGISLSGVLTEVTKVATNIDSDDDFDNDTANQRCVILGEGGKMQSLTFNTNDLYGLGFTDGNYFMCVLPTYDGLSVNDDFVIPSHKKSGTHISIHTMPLKNYETWPCYDPGEGGYDENLYSSLVGHSVLICADPYSLIDRGDGAPLTPWSAANADGIDDTAYQGERNRRRHGRIMCNGRTARFILLMPGQTLNLVSSVQQVVIGNEVKKCLVWNVINSQDFIPQAITMYADYYGERPDGIADYRIYFDTRTGSWNTALSGAFLLASGFQYSRTVDYRQCPLALHMNLVNSPFTDKSKELHSRPAWHAQLVAQTH